MLCGYGGIRKGNHGATTSNIIFTEKGQVNDIISLYSTTLPTLPKLKLLKDMFQKLDKENKYFIC